MEAKPDSESLTALKPRDKPYKVGAGHGLYLEVRPNGSKLWRLKYYFERQERRIALGAFPAVTLAQATEACGQARAMIQTGTDLPSVKPSATLKPSSARGRKPFAWS